MSRTLHTVLISLTAFAGGYITSSLVNPKSGRENRKWLTAHSKETKNWIGDKSQKLVNESEKRIDRISKGIKNTVSENLPDLYLATENLNLTDNDSI